MDEPVHPLIDQEQFFREFIAIYKANRLLWDKNHPQNKSRIERSEALESLLAKCQEYYPEVDGDFVRHKIDTMRNCFRKEYRKVLESRKNVGENNEEIYKPVLWYYNLLLFTVGENDNDDTGPITDLSRVAFWTREYTVLVIDLFKKHPVLFVPTLQENLGAKRYIAYKKIAEDLVKSTGKKFQVEDVRKKVQMLRGQFRKECLRLERLQKRSGKEVKPKLWCYELLSFLKEYVKTADKKVKKRKKSFSDDSDTDASNGIKKECDSDDLSDQYEPEMIIVDTKYDDIYDTIGKNVAHKLRDMSDNQRKYAEKLISDVMYYGLMEELTENSRLSLDGT